jgi:hypothetical protein
MAGGLVPGILLGASPPTLRQITPSARLLGQLSCSCAAVVHEPREQVESLVVLRLVGVGE